MFSIRIVGWDFKGTHEPFAHSELDVAQTVKTVATEIARGALDHIRSRTVTEH